MLMPYPPNVNALNALNVNAPLAPCGHQMSGMVLLMSGQSANLGRIEESSWSDGKADPRIEEKNRKKGISMN